MKTKFLIGIIAFACLLGCKKEEVHKANTTLVVMKDKTQSLDLVPEVLEKWKEQLTTFLSSNLGEYGDEVVVSYIYERTLSASNKYTFDYLPPELNMKGLTENQKVLAKTSHKKQVRKYKQAFITTVINEAFSAESESLSTNVIAAIPMLTEIGKQKPTNQLHAIILSDMKEFSDFGKLHFKKRCKNAILTRTDARRRAEDDCLKISETYLVSDTCLNTVQTLRIVFPTKQLDGDLAYELLPVYWKIVFEHFGLESVTFI